MRYAHFPGAVEIFEDLFFATTMSMQFVLLFFQVAPIFGKFIVYAASAVIWRRRALPSKIKIYDKLVLR